MRLLLDTHVVLSALRTPEQLTSSARAAIVDRRNDVFISSISAFEIATKSRIGKLPGADSLLLAWEENATTLQSQELPISTRHALVAGGLGWDHRDPFDRVLAAQSIAESMTLVTGDRAFRGLGGVRILWD